MTASQIAPIRKIAVTFLAGAIIYVAARLGFELDDDQAQQAAQWIVPVLLGYIVPDPQVRTGQV